MSWSAVERFWFAETDAATLGLVRIAFGTVVMLWTVSLAADFPAFFAPRGVIGDVDASSGPGAWTLLDLADSELAVGTLYVALLSGAVGVLIGWHARVSAAVVVVALVSFERANPYVFNSGDSLLRLLALYMMIAPAGLAFSLDARRRGLDGPVRHPIWPLRLIQIQVSAMYLGAVWNKLEGAAWRDGTAVAYAAGLPDLARFPIFEVFAGSPLAIHIATYATIVVEVGLVVGVWHRRTRFYALLSGVTLHLAIDASIRVGFFTLAVFTAYLSFADPERVRALAGWAQRWPASALDSLGRAWRSPLGRRAGTRS